MRRRAVTDYDLELRQRAIADRTLQRRADRSRRQRLVAITSLVFLVLLVASAPSLVSHSPLGRSLVARVMGHYGWRADAAGIQIGWVTPMRISGLECVGNRAGTRLTVGQLQTTLSLPQLFSAELAGGRFGEMVLRDVHLTCEVNDGSTSIEEDLADLMAPSDTPSAFVADGQVGIQGLHVDAKDAVTGGVWSLKQSSADVTLSPTEVRSQWQGVLSQPGGGEGSVQGQLNCQLTPVATGETMPVSLVMDADSLPLSVISLVARRFPESELPAAVTGDLSGNASMELPPSGHPSVALKKIELRNFTALDARTGRRIWNNELMQVDGDWLWQPGRIVTRQMTAKTDFARLSMNGSFSDSIAASGARFNPLLWLDQVDATANVEVDLSRLQTAMPNLLRLREGVAIRKGSLVVSIEPLASVNRRNSNLPQRRRRLVVRTDAIEAAAGNQIVRITPMEATAVVSSDAVTLAAERFEMRSPFASMVGNGDIASGTADVDVDFGKLSTMIQPLFDFESQNLQGDIRGNVRWDAEPGGLWRMRGQSQITDLAIEFSPGQMLVQKALNSELDVRGRWSNGNQGWSLDELTQGAMRIEGDGMKTDIDLVQAVSRLDRNQWIPLRIRGQGRIESVAEWMRPWLPEPVQTLRGGFDFNARASVNGNGDAMLQTLDGQVNSLRVPMSDRDWRQELVKVHFDGKALWPRQELLIRTMTLTGDAMSAAVQGEWMNGLTDVEVAWRAELDRLQSSTQSKMVGANASGGGVTQPAGFASSPRQAGFANGSKDDGQWDFRGSLEGSTTLVGHASDLHLTTTISGQDLVVSEPLNGRKVTVWAEPALQLDASARMNVPGMTVTADSLQVAGDWFATTLSGSVSYVAETADVQLRGPARFKMEEVSRRLTTLSGTTIVAEGLHQTPLEILYARNKQGQYAFTIKGNLGWETVDTAGMLFGPAEVPFRMTEDTVTISPSRIPVLGVSRLTPRMIGPQVAPLDYVEGTPYSNPGGAADSLSSGSGGAGEILIAGDVHYRPEVWIELAPGPIARRVALTPDMTNKWLKYLAPIASDAARVEGKFSADLQQAVVWIDNPRRSEVRGRLDIEEVRMNAGPLADQVIAGARQLQALAAIGSPARPPRTGRTLITLPAQSVEFQVARGVVNHRALMFDVDRARVVTSGQVDFDGRLNLTAQIPLDAKWLGSDLRGLAGQTMTLPIDGTLSRPSLDSAGIRRVVADFGVQAAQSAVQDAAGNFLQQQLGRGQQQIEQGLNKGLERLRIDKLFGN